MIPSATVHRNRVPRRPHSSLLPLPGSPSISFTCPPPLLAGLSGEWILMPGGPQIGRGLESIQRTYADRGDPSPTNNLAPAGAPKSARRLKRRHLWMSVGQNGSRPAVWVVGGNGPTVGREGTRVGTMMIGLCVLLTHRGSVTP